MAGSRRRKTFFMALLIMLGACWFLKNTLVKMAVIGGAKAITGLDVYVADMNLGLLRSVVHIQGLRVGNPSGFNEPVMIELPEIYVEYRLGSLLRGAPHFDLVRLHLDTLTVIKNAQGQVNLSSIKALQQPPATKPATPEAPKTPANAPEFRIDTLQLKVGRVVYRDYSRGSQPQVREFAVNIDESFKHITNSYAFAGIVVSRALMKTTLAQLGALGDLDVRALQADVTGLLKQSAADILPTAEALSKTAGEAGKKAAGAATETVGAASEAVGEAAGAFKKLLGN
jgi:uncharacterized protein involved in outer membrane biogenesis